MLPRLPDTFDEVRSITVALNADLTKDVFTGRRSSEELVKSTNLSGYKVVTFATHGLLPGELNGLHHTGVDQLTEPSVAGDNNNDGLLTMGEILRSQDSTRDWVVLSACNTGAGNGVYWGGGYFPAWDAHFSTAGTLGKKRTVNNCAG